MSDPDKKWNLEMTPEELECLSEVMRHIMGLMDFSEDKEAITSLQSKVYGLYHQSEREAHK